MEPAWARKPIEGLDAYRASLAQRLDPTGRLHARRSPGRSSMPQENAIVFRRGEEPSVIRAAYAFKSEGLGQCDPWSAARS